MTNRDITSLRETLNLVVIGKNILLQNNIIEPDFSGCNRVKRKALKLLLPKWDTN